jgi:DNA-binding CsgD family transcriptional regulator
VHPTIEHILGCKPDDFTLNLLFERMHPEDAPKMVLKEKATGEFFYNRLPPTKLMHYKSSYTFRLEDYQGNWKTILHQCNPIQVSRQGKIHHSLSVHTDVTHLNIPSDDRVSFIGMYGEPSFYSLSTDPETILEPGHDWTLTSREKEIVQLLAEGYASKQIADYLFLSTHTVDTHRRNLLRKTGTKNTLELTVACVKKGLL